MNWSKSLGIKLLFWIADVLLGDDIDTEKRRELRSIATSFSVDSKFRSAA